MLEAMTELVEIYDIIHRAFFNKVMARTLLDAVETKTLLLKISIECQKAVENFPPENGTTNLTKLKEAILELAKEKLQKKGINITFKK